QLRSLLGSSGHQALVYVGTVSAAEELAAELAVACYHGRQAPEVRRRIQDDFTAGRIQTVVATSAFGMGVDIAGIRRVIHYHLPDRLAAGGAGSGRGSEGGAGRGREIQRARRARQCGGGARRAANEMVDRATLGPGADLPRSLESMEGESDQAAPGRADQCRS